MYYIIILYFLWIFPFTFALVIKITLMTGAKDLQTCLPKAPLLNPLINIEMSKEELTQIVDLVTDSTLFCTKGVLTSNEAARYMGISKSHLYKLTMSGAIPHYKPTGKMCYFNREELEVWLQSNRCSTGEEINDRANKYCMEKGGAR